MQSDAERIAAAFHCTYEKLAPGHGYETREASAVTWPDVPEQNRALMIATVERLIGQGAIRTAPAHHAVVEERDSWRRVAERCESEKQALREALVVIERTFGDPRQKRFPDQIARDALDALTPRARECPECDEYGQVEDVDDYSNRVPCPLCKGTNIDPTWRASSEATTNAQEGTT